MPLPEATTVALMPPCEQDHDQQQRAVAAAAIARANSGSSTGRRRSAGRRASFAIWADTALPAGNGGAMPGRSVSDPPASGAGILPRPAPGNENGGSGGSGMYPPRTGSPIPPEGASLSKRGSGVYRRASVQDMYTRGSVIQPSLKLLGLMEIHDRGGSFTSAE